MKMKKNKLYRKYTPINMFIDFITVITFLVIFLLLTYFSILLSYLFFIVFSTSFIFSFILTGKGIINLVIEKWRKKE